MNGISTLEVRNIQRNLRAGGYYSGLIDGKFGSQTEKAASRYFSERGMEVGDAQRAARALRQQALPGHVPTWHRGVDTKAQQADRAGARARDHFKPAAAGSVAPCPKITCPNPGPLGTLSATYESGSRGCAAIGYDRNGGWSYGKYQIATKNGKMESFLTFLEKRDPDTHSKLLTAGGNTAALAGSKEFKTAWTSACGGSKFTEMQHDYIASTNYEPLVEKVKHDTGLDVNTRSAALRDVVWSVAVQHGGGTPIITRALCGKQVAAMTDEDIIDAIYAERSSEITRNGHTALKYFKRSTTDVQKSVRDRFRRENFCAKQMLNSQNMTLPLTPPPVL